MQKTLDILEKNVQWLVLGLAALFLLWVAYAYVLTPPATIKIGPRVATPADVSMIVHQTAQDLDGQIKNSATPSFPTPDLVSNWQEHIEQPFAEQFASAGAWSNSRVQLNGGPTIVNDGRHFAQIENLPVPPVAVLLPPVTGLSTVSLVPPNMPNNPNPAANPNVNNNGQPVAVQGKDTDWIMIPAGISGPALSQALLAPLGAQAQNPALAGVYNTTLLQVVLERQQSNGVDVNGNPTFPAGDKDIEQVPPLTIYQPVMQPLPSDSQPIVTRYQYIDWASQHQDLIGGPPLNQVLAGDPWAAPQMPQGGVTAPVAPPAAPATPKPAPPPAPVTPPATTPKPPTNNTPPKPAQNNTPPRPAQNNTPPATPRSNTMPPARGGRRSSYVPYDSARPTGMMLALGEGPGGYVPGQPFEPNAFNGGGGGANMGQGVLNPFQITSDVLIWAIDETATPGQTYRYRIVYKLKNPVFGVQNLAPADLVNQLTLKSPPSAWTGAVKAPDMTKFWLVDADSRNERARIDVFHYSKGSWVAQKNMEAHPGDQIPGRELTLVDVRSGDHREKYVLLASDTGDMLRRDASTDAADPDHQTMLNPTPNPNGGPGGAQPPIPGRRGPVGMVGRNE
jgi:hypothetical protein